MIDISVTGLVKSFDLEKKILDGITFQIDTGERVGLLGKNGAGKTTLFRILTGELDYDAGEVSIASGRRLGLISQIPVYPEGYTVEDVLKSAFSRMQRMEDEMNALSQQMASGDESEETLRRYGELSAKFEGLGGYDTETPINKVANGLSIPPEMRERLFDTLSGGEKTRVNLARLLLDGYDAERYDELWLVYTNFVSMMTQEVMIEQLLPVQRPPEGAPHKLVSTVYELPPAETLAQVLPDFLAGRLYSALCDAFASEVAARRSAMDSATKNAGEMISDLKLRYNRARQGAITQEITEIVAGAEH